MLLSDSGLCVAHDMSVGLFYLYDWMCIRINRDISF